MVAQGAVEVNVLVEENADMSRILEGLRACGFLVDAVQEEIGTITGRIDPARLAQLSNVEGVVQVERTREVQISPPGSKVQ